MRFLALGLVVAVGIAGSAVRLGNASSTPAPVLTMEVSDNTIGTGDSVSVDIRVTITGEPLQRYSLVLRFNDEALTAARCDLPQVPQRLPSICDAGHAQDGVFITGYNDPAVSGEWLLARVVLAATGGSGSSSDLAIDVQEFAGANGTELSPVTNSSTVTITGTGTSAVIMGTVFEDSDKDGAAGPGERGIVFREVVLSSPLGSESSTSRRDGKFVFADVQPGEYRISTELDQVFAEGCPTDNPPSLNPLGYPACPPWRELFEPTTPETAEVKAEAGSIVSVDFGGRRMDIQDVSGQAILRGEYAPAGATVTAKVNGNTCGSATVSQTGRGLFELEIRGGTELAGCASDGDQVSFEVAGVPADRVVTWRRGERIGRVDLVAMPDHAWYWLEQGAGANSALVGAAVEAMIDGQLCGSARLEWMSSGISPGPGYVGFSRLVVPRESVSANCGRPGASVKFFVNGADSGVAVAWQPGIQRIELPLAPSPSGTPEPTPNQLPSAGARPGRERGSWPLGAGLALTVAGAACGLMALAKVTRGQRERRRRASG